MIFQVATETKTLPLAPTVENGIEFITANDELWIFMVDDPQDNDDTGINWTYMPTADNDDLMCYEEELWTDAEKFARNALI
jgi:hypothetical protein